MLEECDLAVLVPERDLLISEVRGLWITDRKALAECREEKKSVIEFYDSRDAKIVGEK